MLTLSQQQLFTKLPQTITESVALAEHGRLTKVNSVFSQTLIIEEIVSQLRLVIKSALNDFDIFERYVTTRNEIGPVGARVILRDWVAVDLLNTGYLATDTINRFDEFADTVIDILKAEIIKPEYLGSAVSMGVISHPVRGYKALRYAKYSPSAPNRSSLEDIQAIIDCVNQIRTFSIMLQMQSTVEFFNMMSVPDVKYIFDSLVNCVALRSTWVSLSGVNKTPELTNVLNSYKMEIWESLRQAEIALSQRYGYSNTGAIERYLNDYANTDVWFS